MPKWIIVVVLIIAAGVAAFFLLPKPVQAPTTASTNTAVPNTAYTNKQAVLDTTKGKITLEFYAADAPKTVENFIRLAQQGYYNGVIFHRVVAGFVIQAGDPTGSGSGGDSVFGGTFADELNPATASYQAGYRKGVLAMANRGPNTNTSQFFIMLDDKPGMPHLYTIFGHVTAGQDVVDAIGAVPTDHNDKPLTPVVINKVTIVDKK